MVSRFIVAVSGGVDSVALLNILATGEFGANELVVAHFDHGIRPESADDTVFVAELAKTYGLPFETKREELGKNASEEMARERRYTFLRSVAKKYDAKIVTAHHADDMVETIAINLIRGTGWRGLAVLDSADVTRPLLNMTKAALIVYAKEHKLIWREDTTNSDTRYLRNDVRQKLNSLDEETKELLRMYRDRQVFLRKEIDNESDRLIGASPYRRHIFIAVPISAGMELVRAVFIRECGYAPTRPQLDRALMAIKTAGPSKYHRVMADVGLRFTRTHFVVEHL